MAIRPDNSVRPERHQELPQMAPARSHIPMPAPIETPPSNSIKATLLSGINTVIRQVKTLGNVILLRLSKPLTLDEAKDRILKDSAFGKKLGAALGLYLNRDEKIALFNQFPLLNHLSDKEKKNLDAFIRSYSFAADRNELKDMIDNSNLKTLYPRLDEAKPVGNGKENLTSTLADIRRGDHRNRELTRELLVSSLTLHSQAMVSQMRVGEIVNVAKNEELRGALADIRDDSRDLMAAIKNQILSDDNKDGVANILEFYIDVAADLERRGDAHSFIIVLAVLADPEMKEILKNSDVSGERRNLLKHLEERAESIDSTGNLPGNPQIPSALLLIDHFTESTRGTDFSMVSDQTLSQVDAVTTALHRVAYPDRAPHYDLNGFKDSRKAPVTAKAVANLMESDLDQIYSVLSEAQSNQKLRFMPEGIVAKDRSLLSHVTSRFTGKTDKAANAIQYIMAKVDRALDREPPELDKIGTILKFLKRHEWSTIVFKRNDELKMDLEEIEEKYRSRLGEGLKKQTETTLAILKEIPDGAHNVILVRGSGAAFNARTTSANYTLEDFENFRQFFKDLSRYPELKEEARQAVVALFRNPRFEEALEKHSDEEVCEDLIVLGRKLAQQWQNPEEL